MTRRTFTLAALAATAAGADGPVRLIAHRGGIVGDEFAENSPASIEAAIERGYWMIEVDVRRTRDGRAIIQHDRTFERFFGEPRAVEDTSWEEVRELRATPGGTRPLLFEEAVRLCAGRIRLMLDVKVADAEPEFYDSLGAALDVPGALEPIYSLGGGGAVAAALMRHGVKVSANLERLKQAVERGQPVAERYFLFDLGSRIDAATVAYAEEHGVAVCAALNTFRYVEAGVDDHEGAAADAERLLALGVREFQIDSIYDRYFGR